MAEKQTIWSRIYNALATEIAEGRYRPGDKLPTESELSRRFGVNRHTVRRALAALRDDDMIRVRRGSGAYVSHGRFDYRIGACTRFSKNLAEIGRAAGHRLLRMEALPADSEEAEHLRIRPGALVHVREAVGMAGGAPISHARSVFPAQRFPDLQTHLARENSITKALAASGVTDYQRLWTRLTAERASPLLSQHLEIADGRPVLLAESLNVDSEGAPIEFGRTTFCSDRVQVVVDRDAFST